MAALVDKDKMMYFCTMFCGFIPQSTFNPHHNIKK